MAIKLFEKRLRTMHECSAVMLLIKIEGMISLIKPPLGLVIELKNIMHQSI